MKKPFFSIIIPTYQRANEISKAISSIINQTFEDWELIIIDDGSTDDTNDKVEACNDNRIRYIRQENQGRSAARNHGKQLAIGEWICFQDSDDEYLPNHLGTLYNFCTTNKGCQAVRTGLLMYQNGELVGKSAIKAEKVDAFPYECFTVAAFHSSLMDSIQFDSRFYNGEDLHFLLQIGQQTQISVIQSWTGIYHMQNEKMDGHKKIELLTNRIACLDDILIWNKKLVIPYLKKMRCIAEMQRSKAFINHEPNKILFGIYQNAFILCRYPIDYIKAIFTFINFK